MEKVVSRAWALRDGWRAQSRRDRRHCYWALGDDVNHDPEHALQEEKIGTGGAKTQSFLWVRLGGWGHGELGGEAGEGHIFGDCVMGY